MPISNFPKEQEEIRPTCTPSVSKSDNPYISFHPLLCPENTKFFTLSSHGILVTLGPTVFMVRTHKITLILFHLPSKYCKQPTGALCWNGICVILISHRRLTASLLSFMFIWRVSCMGWISKYTENGVLSRVSFH